MVKQSATRPRSFAALVQETGSVLEAIKHFRQSGRLSEASAARLEAMLADGVEPADVLLQLRSTVAASRRSAAHRRQFRRARPAITV